MQKNLIKEDTKYLAYTELAQEVKRAKKNIGFDENENPYIKSDFYDLEEKDTYNENVYVFLQSRDGSFLDGRMPDDSRTGLDIGLQSLTKVTFQGERYYVASRRGKMKNGTEDDSFYLVCAMISEQAVKENYRGLWHQSYLVIGVVGAFFILFALLLRYLIAVPMRQLNESIKKSGEKNCLYLHFTMDDTPSLTPAIKRRYESLYSGAFYDRFVLGKWVAAQGLVYPFFSRSVHVAEPVGIPSRYFISCDYGTVNPSSFGLWGEYGGRWYRLSEYYFDSRREGEQRTDEEHYAALEQLAGDLNIEAVIADPSAASFLECIRRHGRFRAVPAKNDVIDGIRRVSDALKERRILFSQSCTDCLREFSLYRWDNTAARDAPRKEYDHAMDDVRYFVSTVLAHEEDGFFALAMSR